MESINHTFFWWALLAVVGILGAYLLTITWTVLKTIGSGVSLKERIRIKNICRNLKTLKTTSHAEMRKWKAYRSRF